MEAWRIHRHIGMSGDLLTRAVMRESGYVASSNKLASIEKRHSELLRKLSPRPQSLPGATKLLRELRRKKILHGIATSGKPAEMKLALNALGIGSDTVVVNRTEAPRAKPEPDLFLKCQQRLGVAPQECYAVGDAIWDLFAARRAGMLPIALLCGGNSQDELSAAGPYRIFSNPAELHDHLEELGLQP